MANVSSGQTKKIVQTTATTPEATVVGDVGDIISSANGKLWKKATGAGTNTGWVEIPAGVVLKREVLTPTSQNTLPALANSYNSTVGIFDFFVNGVFQKVGTDFTVTGTTVTWVAATAGFNLETTDTVIVQYSI